MNKLKFALIGCGRISTNHINALLDNFEKVELTSVCDILKDEAKRKADEYIKKAKGKNLTIKRPTIYENYQEMLDKENIDVCVICTESGYHAEISLDCLNSQKHVLVEKPMAMSIIDADRMIQTAQKNGLKLSVCYQNRFNPPIQKLRQAINEKRFGRIFAGTACILWNRNRKYYDKAKWRCR